MKVKIAGIKPISYISKKSNMAVEGTELHCLYWDEHVNGTAVERFFVSKRVNMPDVSISDDVDLLFDRFGRVDFVQIVK